MISFLIGWLIACCVVYTVYRLICWLFILWVIGWLADSSKKPKHRGHR